MKKTELIKEVAARTGSTQKAIKEILDTMQDVVFEVMNAEGEVKLFDGVTLAGVHKDARTARNPIDGSTVEVPEKTAPKAKFGKACKDAINA